LKAMKNDYRVIILVKGRVQGVGYRYSTQEMARTLGLTGFVRNMDDGSVYTEVQGNREAINVFLAWCKEGPARAAVDSVECTYAEPVGFSDFQIRR